MENTNKEKEIWKIKPNRNSGVENTITAMKNSLDEMNQQIWNDKRMSDLKDNLVEITVCKAESKKEEKWADSKTPSGISTNV